VSSNWQDSIVRIMSSDPEIDSFGTGFVISHDEELTSSYVLTCAHVVRAVGLETVKVRGLHAIVVALNDDIDLAVLRLNGLQDVPLLFLSFAGKPDDGFVTAGFQKHDKGFLIRELNGKLDREVGTEGKEQVDRTKAWDLKITDDYQLQPGYSGSPVVVNGNVIAVVSTKLGEDKGVAISVEALKRAWPEMPAPLFKSVPLSRATDGNLIWSASMLVSPLPAFNPQWLKELDASGGAVPLDSQFYVERQVDAPAKELILRSGVTIRIKGSRQVGKTSLLARLLHRAENRTYPFIYIDFQDLEEGHFHSLDTLLYYLAYRIADEHNTNQSPDTYWQGQMKQVGPKDKLTHFLSKEVLAHLNCPFILVLDEVDRLFAYEHFRNDFFSLIRSWHNKRAMPHFHVWKKLNIVLAYSTEAFLFISDLNQSPFNVGTDYNLTDFDRPQVELVNYKHGSPVKTGKEMDCMMSLLHGHPFLVRKAWYALTVQQFTVEELLRRACDEDGPFEDHLRHYLLQLQKNQEQSTAMKLVIQNHTCPTDYLFYQLRSAGLVAGSSRTNAWPRCGLYEQYFQKHL
jgi:GTPase SAR1 family protein